MKSRVSTRVAVGEMGLAGDEQADLTVHGGREKAVYGYGLEHYSAWRSEFPEHDEVLNPGAFGENLTIEGMTERDICVGDIHRIGGAVLQVCQPRQPCFKLSLHFGDNRLPKAMVKSGRAGWYYRVLEEGDLGVADDIELIGRPQPDFPFSRLVSIVNHRRASVDDLKALATMSEVALWLRKMAEDGLS